MNSLEPGRAVALGNSWTTSCALQKLEARVGANWKNIREAQARSEDKLMLLNNALSEYANSDLSVVAFGSVARREVTDGSDLDWTLLVDGISRPEHMDVVHAISGKLKLMNEQGALGMRPPGREGVFGSLASTHNLIHHIGGEEDTNANTTRRILLLLESVPLGKSEAYDRVMRNVLWRYLDEDRSLWFGSGPYKVPHFLFNDVARYWRTMAVDFAYKQRARNNDGFALRNTKLRLSRKLLFMAGMVACFECHLGFSSDKERNSFYGQKQVPALIDRLQQVLSQTPLNILAAGLLRYKQLDAYSKKLLDSYEEFVIMLNEPNSRERLEKMSVDEFEEDPVAKRARTISHQFHDAVRQIFLTSDTDLGKLTIEYGVF